MMRSDLVVLPEPSIDCDLSLFGGVEPFRGEHFFSQGPVDALVVRILPRRARIDLDRRYSNFSEPFLKMFGNELAAVI